MPDKRLITANFEKMRSHFNCLSEIEAQHGSLTDNDKLREVLKQNAFLLGLESCKNKHHLMELNLIKRNAERLRVEKHELETAEKTKQSELQQVKSQRYSIDFDFY